VTRTDLNDPSAIEAADPSGMLRTILDLARQCREGYEAGRAVRELPDASTVTAIAVCGMGGSGVAGDFLRALYHDRLTVPLEVVKGPQLPAFCGRETLVLCSSYSGGTAETLGCFEEASERGCRLVSVSSGGELAVRSRDRGVPVVTLPGGAPGPRAALGFLLLGALGALESMGLVPAVADDLEDAAQVLGALADELAPRAPDNRAKDLAGWIDDRVPVVWGAEGIGAVAAARWKTELNENAKLPAFAGTLPELDHNEVVGWSEGAGKGFVVIALRHEGEHPEVAKRFPVSLEIAEGSGAEVREVAAAGQCALARLLSLAMLGGATSAYLGILRGFDPTPIEAIDRLKSVLEERER
jgi:glucose/mannose-6-phosphate isomerase